MSMAYTKIKSVSKVMAPKGPDLAKTTLATMKRIADVVGATLGPGGQPVLIERQEYGLPALITKDGVTVFRSLGFSDPIAHSVMESARDAAVRTVTEAGDGTTTATVLAEAIVRLTSEYCARNPKVSSQRVVRRLQQVFDQKIEPCIRDLAIKNPDRKTLKAVAGVSANGDSDLAEKVMECFDLVGDAGNVTLSEQSGPTSYQVEKIEGFPITIGFEESCGRFSTMFLNDAGNSRCLLDRPLFLCYNGTINDYSLVFAFFSRLAISRQEAGQPLGSVVLIANGFSDSVLGSLAMNFTAADTIRVVPLITPKGMVMNGEFHFLEDVAAITGAQVLDPISSPMDQAQNDVLGRADSFEMYRFRSTIIGQNDADEILDRVETLQAQLENPLSQLDATLLQERIGKLTGGIAKLKILGSSSGELKERRDRAEDAICAVRGAIKHGVVPGGGWTLLRVAVELLDLKDPVITEVLVEALQEPLRKLLANIGMDKEEATAVIESIFASAANNNPLVYDGLENKFVDAHEGGILDSLPAVLEAIRSSLSIASLLGTLGGVVVFQRDQELERREASANNEFLRNANINEANERW
jgi:chaperonin GroEL